MNRVTLVIPDSVVVIDNDAVNISFDGIDPNIHAVQWMNGVGHIEYKDGSVQDLDNLSDFTVFIQAAQDEIERISLLNIPTLETLIQLKLMEAKGAMSDILKNSSINVELSTGTYPFGTDKSTLDELSRVLNAISLGIDITLPKTWYPKGATDPILCTEEDLKTIFSALLNRREELKVKYFIHKENILALTTIEAAEAYDLTTGW